METRSVADSAAFSEEKMQKNALFDSPHLFYDAYCLLPGQSQKVHAHEGSDKIYYVLNVFLAGVGFHYDDHDYTSSSRAPIEAYCGVIFLIPFI